MNDPIKSFDRAACRRVHDALNEAARKVAAEFGVALKPGNGRFSPTSYTVKVEFAVIGEGGIAETQEAQDFKLYAPALGIAEDAIGKPLTDAGKSFRIVGFKPRSTRPVIVEEIGTGRRYKMSAERVALAYPRRNGTEG